MAFEEQPVHLGHFSLISMHWNISVLFLGSELLMPLPKAFIAVPHWKHQKFSTLKMFFPQTVVTQVCCCKVLCKAREGQEIWEEWFSCTAFANFFELWILTSLVASTNLGVCDLQVIPFLKTEGGRRGSTLFISTTTSNTSKIHLWLYCRVMNLRLSGGE